MPPNQTQPESIQSSVSPTQGLDTSTVVPIPPEVAVTPAVQTATIESKVKPSSNKKKIIILAAIAILAVVGVSLYSIFSGSKIVLVGTVTDKTGEPIKNVFISVNMKNATTTDYLGYYSYKAPANTSLVVTYKKNGYVPIHKAIETSNKDHQLDVVIYEEAPFVNVDIKKDISIKMGGAGLNSNANSFLIKGSNEIATSAKISLTPFDPTKPEDANAFPGDFTGEQKDGSVTNIESFGFEKVQVRDNNDKPLDLVNGKTADLIIPISPSQVSSSPETIPLWNFDEAKGMWVEKGTATKTCDSTGCFYKGQITTIASWWNCDAGIGNSGVINAVLSFGGKLWDFLKSIGTKVADLFNRGVGAVGNLGNKIVDAVKSAYDYVSEIAGAFWEGLKIGYEEAGMGMVDLAKDLGLVNRSDYDTGEVQVPFSRDMGKVAAIAGTLATGYGLYDVAQAGVAMVGNRLAMWLATSIPVYHYSVNAAKTLPGMLQNGVKGSTRLPGIPQMMDKLTGTSNLWVTKYAPETTDSRLINNLFAMAKTSTPASAKVEVDFALKSYMSRGEMLQSLVSNPTQLWKTGGFQYGSVVQNIGYGKTVPLANFEIVPLTQGAYNAAQQVAKTSGGSIVVQDVAQFSTSAGAQASYYLHLGAVVPSAVVSGGVVAVGAGTAIVKTLQVTVPAVNTVRTWQNNSQNTSFQSVPNNPTPNGGAAILAVNSLLDDVGSSKDNITIDINSSSSTILNLASNQILALDDGANINYYNDGHLIVTEDKSNSHNNVYYYYDENGLAKEVSYGVEKSYEYSIDGLSATVMTKVGNSETKKRITISATERKITEKDLQTNAVIETLFDSDLDVIKVTETASSSYMSADLSGKTLVFNIKTPDMTESIKITRDGNIKRYELLATQGTSTRKVITVENYSNQDNILTSKSQYYEGLATSLKPTGVEDVTYTYVNSMKKNWVDGKDLSVPILAKASVVAKSSEGSELYNHEYAYGQPDANGIRQFTKGPMTMSTNSNDQLVEVSMDKNSQEYKDSFKDTKAADWVKYAYNDRGYLSGETKSDGSSVLYRYDAAGLMVGVETLRGVVRDPKESINSSKFSFVNIMKSIAKDLVAAVGLADTATNNRDTSIYNIDNLQLKLTGIDYSSTMIRDVSLDSNGNLIFRDANNPIFGKPGAKAKLTLESPKIISEPIVVTVPIAGKSLDVDIQYAGIVIPMSVSDLENAANINVDISSDNGETFGKKMLLSKKNSKDVLTVLVNAGRPHKVTIRDTWASSSQVIDVPSQSKNDLFMVDEFKATGKLFEDFNDAEMEFLCGGIIEEDKRNACYRDYIIADARKKDDPLRCLDAAQYDGTYGISSGNCLIELDKGKSVTLESVKSRLSSVKNVKDAARDWIYDNSAEEYHNQEYCTLVTSLDTKANCNRDYIIADAEKKDDPLRCLDAAQYGTYGGAYSASCLISIDKGKSVTLESIKSRLSSVKNVKSDISDNIYDKFAEKYHNQEYCTLVTSLDTKASCNRDYIIADAEKKDDPLRCLDAAQYAGIYNYSASCLISIDKGKSVTLESVKSRLSSVKNVKSDISDYIYEKFAEDYHNQEYCTLVTSLDTKARCVKDFNK